jgi:RNA polymerase sigma factor (sigma-70 family)
MLERAEGVASHGMEDILAQRHHMRNLCLRMLGSHPNKQTIADDLVQEATIKAWRSAQNFRGEAQLSTWVYRITANVVKSFTRTERRRPRMLSLTLPHENDYGGEASEFGLEAYYKTYSCEKAYITLLDSWKILRSLPDLPSQTQAILRLRGEYDLTNGEISRILGIPLQRVKREYFEVIKKLQQRFAAT